MLRLAVLLILWSSAACSGAWPRDKGSGFVANAIEIRGVQFGDDVERIKTYSSFYMEYGLGRSLTLGLHLGHGSDSDIDGRMFLRAPVWRGENEVLAVELGLGQAGRQGYGGLGVHYGRGVTVMGLQGWIAAEGRVEQTGGDGFGAVALRRGKLDLTFGLTHRNGIKTMAQFFATELDGEVYATIGSSAVFPLFRKMKIETGLLLDLQSRDGPGLKFGVWNEF